MILIAYEKSSKKIIATYVENRSEPMTGTPDLWLKNYCEINQLDPNLYLVGRLTTWDENNPIVQGRDRYNEITGQIETDPTWLPNSK
jgi:hypothetical protein